MLGSYGFWAGRDPFAHLLWYGTPCSATLSTMPIETPLMSSRSYFKPLLMLIPKGRHRMVMHWLINYTWKWNMLFSFFFCIFQKYLWNFLHFGKKTMNNHKLQHWSSVTMNVVLFCVLLYILHENITLAGRQKHCPWMPANFKPTHNTNGVFFSRKGSFSCYYIHIKPQS